jgi:hypothetical protein
VKQTQTDALIEIRRLLEVDLNTVTWEQEQSAKTKLQADPSTWELMLAVKAWARALADVCRRHSAKCAEIHADRGEQDPATAALGTMLRAVCAHLRLQDPDNSLLFLGVKLWPKSNAVRDFVLYVAGAPVELKHGELVVTPRLPRWEPKGSLGRRIAGLSPDAPQGPNAAFLSIKETRKVLRGLEESFQDVLQDRLGASFSEAVLATYKDPQAARALQPRQSHSGGKRPGPKQNTRTQVVMEILRGQPKLSVFEVCKLMDGKYGAANYGGLEARFPTLAKPNFCGTKYPSWAEAHRNPKARKAITEFVSRLRPMTTNPK